MGMDGKVMAIKKNILLFILLLLFLSACDSEFEVVDIEIVDYPETIVYNVGHDSGLDLNGGRVKLTDRTGQGYLVDMSELINITHAINFNQEGVYVVELQVSEKVKCKFPIQVIKCNNDVE